MSQKETLFTKEIMFHTKNHDELLEKQFKVVQALETLELKYEIKRTAQYATNTPTWHLTVFK